MWSILANVPCAFEKNVYCAAFGWNVLYISIKFIWSNVSFKVSVSLLIFCLDDLSIDVSGVLKSPTIIVLLSAFFFVFFNICFMYLGAPMLDVYIYIKLLHLFLGLIPLLLYNILFVSCYNLCCKVYFVWYEYSYPKFLFVFIRMEYFFQSPHFQSVCVFRFEVNLL